MRRRQLLCSAFAAPLAGAVESGAPTTARREFAFVGWPGSGPLGLMSSLAEVQPGSREFSCAGWVRLVKTNEFAQPQSGLVLWRLTDGDLPIPFAHWRHHDILVQVTFLCAESKSQPVLLARWALYNEGPQPHEVDFLLLLSPGNSTAGVTRLQSRARDRLIEIDNQPRVACVTRPVEFDAANARARFRAIIAPRATVPFDFTLSVAADRRSEPPPLMNFEAEHARMRALWRERVKAVQLDLPDVRYAEAWRASVCYESILNSPILPFSRSPIPAPARWPRLKSFIDHQCAPGVYAWCDDFEADNSIACTGDYVTGRAFAAYRALLQSMLFEERDGTLTIGDGFPLEWALRPQPLCLVDADTAFGKFGCAVTHNDRRRQIVIDLTGAARPPRGFAIAFPLPAKLERAAVDGKPATIASPILVPAEAKRVELGYARSR